MKDDVLDKWKQFLKEDAESNGYGKFPLNALVKQAKKFNDFKQFSRFYSQEIYHGYYWHLTDNPNFQISDQAGPRDMSSMSSGKISEKGALMITSDLEHWDENYNTNPDTGKREIHRNYFALIDASDLEPQNLRQVSRGFGNEIYVNSVNAKKLKIVGIYDRGQALRLERKFEKMIPQSEEALEQLYIYAHNGA